MSDVELITKLKKNMKPKIITLFNECGAGFATPPQTFGIYRYSKSLR